MPVVVWIRSDVATRSTESRGSIITKLHWCDTGVALHLAEQVGRLQQVERFRTEYGETSRPGLLLHTGDTLEWLPADVLAVPWWRVL